MAKGLVEQSSLTAIADAIRAKGVEGNWKPAEMAGAIANIVAGGDATYIPTELEHQEKIFSVYPYMTKTSYVASTYTGTFTFNFPGEGTQQEYRMAVVLYTYSGSVTKATVTIDGTATNFFNNKTQSLQPFYISVPAGTKEIICTGTFPQYQNATARFFLMSDLTTDFTEVQAMIDNLVQFKRGEVTWVYTISNASYVSMKIVEVIIQQEKYTLITPGGITLADGTEIKDFKGVILNDSNG